MDPVVSDLARDIEGVGITTLVLAGSFTPIRRVLDTSVDRRLKSPAVSAHAQNRPIGGQLSLDDPEVVRQIEAIAKRVARDVHRGTD